MPANPGIPQRDYIDMRLAEMDLRHQQRFDAQTRALDSAFVAAKEAVSKAEVAAEKRFDSVNEFRGQLGDQAKTFMPRIEAEQRISAIVEKMDLLRFSSERIVGKSEGLGSVWSYVFSIISLAVAIVAMFRS